MTVGPTRLPALSASRKIIKEVSQRYKADVKPNLKAVRLIGSSLAFRDSGNLFPSLMSLRSESEVKEQ